MKTILITGGSRGIGRATALRAARDGWSVAINYRSDEDAALETADRVCELGGQAIALRGDVSIEADVIAVFDATQTKFGRIDGVVVNAGIVAAASPLVDMPAERLRRMFDVNVFGAYLCAREAARLLSKDRGGAGGSVVL